MDLTLSPVFFLIFSLIFNPSAHGFTNIQRKSLFLPEFFPKLSIHSFFLNYYKNLFLSHLEPYSSIVKLDGFSSLKHLIH